MQDVLILGAPGCAERGKEIEDPKTPKVGHVLIRAGGRGNDSGVGYYIGSKCGRGEGVLLIKRPGRAAAVVCVAILL